MICSLILPWRGVIPFIGENGAYGGTSPSCRPCPRRIVLRPKVGLCMTLLLWQMCWLDISRGIHQPSRYRPCRWWCCNTTPQPLRTAQRYSWYQTRHHLHLDCFLPGQGRHLQGLEASFLRTSWESHIHESNPAPNAETPVPSSSSSVVIALSSGIVETFRLDW